MNTYNVQVSPLNTIKNDSHLKFGVDIAVIQGRIAE